MTARLLALAAILAGLVAWERSLAGDAAEERASVTRIERLVSEELPRVAGLSIARSGGTPWVYARQDGVWRCLTYEHAPASEAAITRVFEALLGAEGAVRSRSPSDAASYGFGEEGTKLLRLHGAQMADDPDLDTVFGLELGSSIPGAEGCYVRFPRESEVWAIDADLVELLEPPSSHTGPPLLEPYVIPSWWRGTDGVFAEVRVEFDDRRLVLRARELSPGTQASPEEIPVRFEIDDGTESRECVPALALSYCVFLGRIPYAKVYEAEAAPRLGLTPPEVRITLVPQDENVEIVELRVGVPETGDGPLPLYCSASKVVYAVPRELQDLFVPYPNLVTQFGGGGNRWEEFLRAASMEQQRELLEGR